MSTFLGVIHHKCDEYLSGSFFLSVINPPASLKTLLKVMASSFRLSLSIAIQSLLISN